MCDAGGAGESCTEKKEKQAMNWFWVALGGGLGAVARYSLSGWLLHHSAQQKFPWPTFVVNVSGCLIAGLLFALAAKHDILSPNLRLFLFTGVLGGFTTFSAFGLETAHLLKRGDVLTACIYVLASVVCGLAAILLAYRFTA
jgi:CrcB protein